MRYSRPASWESHSFLAGQIWDYSKVKLCLIAPQWCVRYVQWLEAAGVADDNTLYRAQHRRCLGKFVIEAEKFRIPLMCTVIIINNFFDTNRQITNIFLHAFWFLIKRSKTQYLDGTPVRSGENHFWETAYVEWVCITPPNLFCRLNFLSHFCPIFQIIPCFHSARYVDRLAQGCRKCL
jgi:hypothetical protein